jgi:hypothetical protein
MKTNRTPAERHALRLAAYAAIQRGQDDRANTLLRMSRA